MPNLRVLVHEVVAGELGAADLAWEELHVDDRMEFLRHRLKVHRGGVEVPPLVLLVAVVRLERVVAEEAAICGADACLILPLSSSSDSTITGFMMR
jgi:hypothetical protein